MANLKASKKDIKRIIKRTDGNRQVKTRLKSLAKKILSLTKDGGSAEELKVVATEYVSAIDKAAKRNIIHKNKADRVKQGVSQHIFKAAAS